MCDAKNCESQRLLYVSGKCSDLCWVRAIDGDFKAERSGYVPAGLGVCADNADLATRQMNCGDYVEFELCLDCGKIQGKFPIGKQAVKAAFAKEA